MSRTFDFLSATLVFATALSAQGVQTAMRTADAVGVYANRQIDGARAGTEITRPLALAANDGRGARSTSVAAHGGLRSGDGRAAAGAKFGWSALAAGGNVAGTLGGSPLSAGSQAYALRFASREAVRGALVILFRGRAANARAGASVQLGDETRNFAADGTTQHGVIRGVTVGPRGLGVSINIGGQARAGDREGAGYEASMSVLFVTGDGGDDRCRVDPDQDSCEAGGTLRGRAAATDRGATLALGLEGALPNAIGVTIVSPRNDTFPIGNSHCIFFRLPIVAGTFRTDDNGNARTSMQFPVRDRAQFFVHQGTLLIRPGGVRLATSNTLRVSCR